MTTNEYMELLSKTDEEYDTVEEKNYQLVHKMMEILPSISDEQLEQIKEEIIRTNNILHFLNMYVWQVKQILR
mgnify:CR=1 FL=1